MIINKESLRSQVDAVYPYALMWMYFAIWFIIIYLFGIVSWPAIVSIPFAVALICLSPIRKKRYLGMLTSFAILLLAIYSLFGWQTSQIIKTVGKIECKYNDQVGISPNPPKIKYIIHISFNGMIQFIEVNESTYKVTSVGDNINIQYHMEQLVGGLLRHPAVRHISSGKVIDGGSRKFWESGSNYIASLFTLIISGIPLILIVIGKISFCIKRRHTEIRRLKIKH